jgi:hypothetical protein
MQINDLEIFTPFLYENLQKQRIGSQYDGGYVISLDIDTNYL